MQKELQFTLSIIGILIIGGVLLHGMWTIRKSSKKQKKPHLETRQWGPTFNKEEAASDEKAIYDDVGVGKARVILEPEDDRDDLGLREYKNASLNIDEAETEDERLNEVELNEGNAHYNAPDSELNTNNNSHLDDQRLVHESKEIDEVITHSLSDQDTLDSGVLTANDANFDIDSANTDSETPSNNIQDDSISIDAKKVNQQSESPVYSNVVTQPKPEFTRPVQGSAITEDNFGQPPEFLLRKTEGTIKETVADKNAVDDHISEPPTKPTEENRPVPAASEPRSDFSLNIQEGPEAILESKEQNLPEGVEKELSFAEQAKRFVRRNKKTVGEKIRKEPVMKDKASDEQMRIDFEENEGVKAQESVTSSKSNETQSAETKPTNTDNGATDVLVLNVRAKDENPIQGASLLPMLLTLGFKFGEHDIFHRHVNSNGKGPILFSLTNMFKPGVFDIDNIENFNTFGLSLFMMLPIEGDAQQVFNMMHNAARKLSDEFDCRILDGNKVGVSKQSLQQYVERIREFERKRIKK